MTPSHWKFEIAAEDDEHVALALQRLAEKLRNGIAISENTLLTRRRFMRDEETIAVMRSERVQAQPVDQDAAFLRECGIGSND